MSDTVALTENEIYERMVATILEHHLPPGTKLVEDRLATAFGASRTRIRPVLVRLANERIVTPTLIEHFVVRACPEEINSLIRCIAEEETARSKDDMRRAIRLSGDSHWLIANAAGHQTLGAHPA